MAEVQAKSSIGCGVYIIVDGEKKELMEVKSLPEFSTTPSKLDSTHLKNTCRTYVDGVADMGTDLQITCNAMPSGSTDSNIDLINSLNSKKSYQIIIEYPALKWMVMFWATLRGHVGSVSVDSVLDYIVSITPKSDPVRIQMDTTYRLTYMANAPAEGSASGETTDDQSYEAGAEATVKECGTTVEGYRFVGWSETASGEGNSYRAGDTVVMISNLTLYAQWIQEAA